MAGKNPFESSQHGTKVDKTAQYQNQQQVLKEMVKPHLEAFNFTLEEGLQAAVKNIRPLQVVDPKGRTMVLKLGSAEIGRPMVGEGSWSAEVPPAKCYEGGGTTYKAKLNVTIKWELDGKTSGSHTRVVGEVPIMVKSRNCNLWVLSDEEDARECGGYFIINGHKRAIPMIIRPRRNFPMAIVKQAWKDYKHGGRLYTEFGMELHCLRRDQSASRITLHCRTDGDCDLAFLIDQAIPPIDQGRCIFPVAAVLKALVNLSDEEIFLAVMEGNRTDTEMERFVKGWLTNKALTSREKALEFIGKRYRWHELPTSTIGYQDVGRQILKEFVCVHLSKNSDKFNLLVFMIRKLFALQSGKCGPDLIDSPMSQEVLLGGHLYLMALKEKLQGYLKHLCTELKQQTTQNLDLFAGNIADTVEKADGIDFPDIGHQMEEFVKTGQLQGPIAGLTMGVLSQSKSIKMELSILAPEIDNFYRSLSDFRSIMYFNTYKSEGFLCPATPPAPNIYHLAALCAIVTKQPDTSNMTNLLLSLGMTPCDVTLQEQKGCYSVSILLDGKVVGAVSSDKAVIIEATLRYLKSEGLKQVPLSLEIGYVPSVEGARGQYPGLYLFTTPARMVRPVRNLRAQCTELIGSFEQKYMVDIAVNPAEIVQGHTTHRELCKDYKVCSVISSISPFKLTHTGKTVYESKHFFCKECMTFTRQTTPVAPAEVTCRRCSYSDFQTTLDIYLAIMSKLKP